MAIAEDVKRIQRRQMSQCLCFTLTVACLSMLFASSMINMQHKMNARMDEIEKYHESFTSRFDDSLKNMNSTVEKVQENVEQQAQDFNENVSSQLSHGVSICWNVHYFRIAYFLLAYDCTFAENARADSTEENHCDHVDDTYLQCVIFSRARIRTGSRFLEFIQRYL